MKRDQKRIEIIGTHFDGQKHWLNKKRWYWRIIASNGKVLCHSEQYESLRACRRAVAIIKEQCSDMGVVEVANGDMRI